MEDPYTPDEDVAVGRVGAVHGSQGAHSQWCHVDLDSLLFSIFVIEIHHKQTH